MMMKKIFIVALVVFSTVFVYAQNTITPEQYVAMYKDIAIKEMKRMGIPAAITLAQGILETESGNSDLVKKSNNHFGIKCKSSWTAASVSHNDDAAGECFRVYKTAEDSYRDHSNFLRGSDRYSWLFKLDVKDYTAWANGLKKAGYATNPNYPKILIKNIEQYNLQQYTLMAADDVPKFESNKYADDKEEKIKQDNIALSEKNTVAKTQLNDPNKIVANTVPATVSAMPPPTTHIVQAREGLYTIARKYNITVQQLAEWNNLKGDPLSIGQVLIIAK